MKIPYYAQQTLYTCGPASIRMILKYYGISKTEEELEKNLGTTHKGGTNYSRVRNYVITLGLKCTIHKIKDKNKGIKKLRQCVKRGIPILVTVNRYIYDKKTPRTNQEVNWESRTYSFHIIVVTDIDDNFVYFNDPHINIKRTKKPINQFMKAWYYKIYPGYMVSIKN